MKYFALGSLCVLVFLMLAGCGAKREAAPKPSPSANQGTYVPDDPAKKIVFDDFVKTHPFRKVTNIQAGKIVKRPAKGEYPADSVQNYRVTSVKKTDPKDTKVDVVPYDPQKKVVAIRKLPKK